MSWYVHVAYFFGGAFLANALPHLVAGVSGQPFPSPFGSPPFRGSSSPASNVVWALVNLAVAYLLLVRVDRFDLRSWSHMSACFVGFGAMALQIPGSLRRIREGGR